MATRNQGALTYGKGHIDPSTFSPSRRGPFPTWRTRFLRELERLSLNPGPSFDELEEERND